jgi:hypothetical protein
MQNRAGMGRLEIEQPSLGCVPDEIGVVTELVHGVCAPRHHTHPLLASYRCIDGLFEAPGMLAADCCHPLSGVLVYAR